MNETSPYPPAYPPYPPPASETETKDLWWLGAIINLVGSVAINLGTNIIKLAHNKRALLNVPDEEKPPISKFKEWIVGMVIFSAGNVLNFVSFGFAAQSLLAALGCIQFVSNVFIAYFLLKEKITKIVIIATCCIVGGCILLVLFGNQSSESFTVQELIDLYSQPAYVVYLTMLGVFVFGSYIIYLHGKSVIRKLGTNAPAFWTGVLPVAYSIFSALLGTQSVLFSKSMSVLLRKTFSGDNQLGFWYTWVVLPLFVFTAVFWVTRLNKGLRMFPAMLIVPMMQICWTLFSIVSGMLYFKEYTSFRTISWIMFPLGVSIVFVGVFLLTKSGKSKASNQLTTEKQLAIMSHAAEMSVSGGSRGALTEQGAAGAVRGEHHEADTEKGPELDTLRLTNLDSSTAGAGPKSPSEARRGHSVRDREANVSGDVASDVDSNIATARSSIGDENSMMGTVRKGLRSIQHKLGADFGLDTRTAKQLLGFGDDGVLPAISLFGGVPVVDMTMKIQKSVDHQHHQLITSLPRSRFYMQDSMTARSLPAIDEFDAQDPTELVSLTKVVVDEGDGEGSVFPRAKASTSSALGRHISDTGVGSYGTSSGSSAPGSSSSSGASKGDGLPSALKVPVDFVLSARTPLRKLQPPPGSMGRILDKAVDGVLNSLIQSTPSEIHRAIRGKQGYGSLVDRDEDLDAIGAGSFPAAAIAMQTASGSASHAATSSSGLLGHAVSAGASLGDSSSSSSGAVGSATVASAAPASGSSPMRNPK